MEQASLPVGKVGYVALLGRPNTGKSTFLNTVLNYHLAPVSRKPQTTRKRLLGVYSEDGAQILFLDTPGIHEGGSELDVAMMSAIRHSLQSADVVLCLVDPTRRPGAEDQLAAKTAAAAAKPVIIGLNKSDLATPEEQAAAEKFWRELIPAGTVLRFCALQLLTLQPVLQALRERLPQGPFLCPPDTLTDAFERVLGTELIREALLENLEEEVPHATAVVIDAWEEDPDRRRIRATLHVEREQQKAILIGAGGQMIKRLRLEARKKLEDLCGMRVELTLWVKVTPDWRRNKGALREFGYL